MRHGSGLCSTPSHGGWFGCGGRGGCKGECRGGFCRGQGPGGREGGGGDARWRGPPPTRGIGQNGRERRDGERRQGGHGGGHSGGGTASEKEDADESVGGGGSCPSPPPTAASDDRRHRRHHARPTGVTAPVAAAARIARGSLPVAPQRAAAARSALTVSAGRRSARTGRAFPPVRRPRAGHFCHGARSSYRRCRSCRRPPIDKEVPRQVRLLWIACLRRALLQMPHQAATRHGAGVERPTWAGVIVSD
mmetsp:Transcript_34635/g.111269  ORF Transcript_34635/g.111269 Transcript_34635/m.111269 type:complete len:249 (+) Transcript_34635:1460-2206(+)